MRVIGLRAALAAGFGLTAIAGLSGPAYAKFKVIYSFCSQGGDQCLDGDGARVAGLTGDGAGNLYGITDQGGAAGSSGTIFKLSKTGTKYSYQVLHNIAACTDQDCPEGHAPQGSLVVDTAGNLYGTMSVSNSQGHGGVVFELTTAGEYKVLHRFCQTDCTDGDSPYAGLTYKGANTGAVYDGVSLLYGTTTGGGNDNLTGTVFGITPSGDLTKLSNMCRFTEHNDCREGGDPLGSLAVDNAGTVFGLNHLGEGGAPNGLIWSVSNNLKVLHDFCTADTGCKDGQRPDQYNGVVLDAASTTLFGTTSRGGKQGEGLRTGWTHPGTTTKSCMPSATLIRAPARPATCRAARFIRTAPAGRSARPSAAVRTMGAFCTESIWRPVSSKCCTAFARRSSAAPTGAKRMGSSCNTAAASSA